MMSSDYWEIEVSWRDRALDPRRSELLGQVANLFGAESRTSDVEVSDVYYLRDAGLEVASVQRVAEVLLSDPVVQTVAVHAPGDATSGNGARDSGAGIAPTCSATVLQKPGVMDPVEASLLQGLRDLSVADVEVRTALRYRFAGALPPLVREQLADKVLANPVIQDVFWDDSDALPQPFRRAAAYEFSFQRVSLEGLSDDDLTQLSRDLGLSLNTREMQTIRDHFQALGRPPTDIELETVAQTWSEHCCHKTLTGLIEHASDRQPDGERIDNLLRDTIMRVTREIDAPWCLSVFEDNAGVIAFDDEYGISFKVETHNHPSAIEPYGGAGTGIGGVLRDTLGTGLGAKPIVNTDVFCFGPPDLPDTEVPPGALHPLRVLRGVVGGVRDYGNRMGIPTASGAVFFDRRYVGNPLVFAGSVGLIPRDAIRKSAQPGDRVYVLGGRTGRDGIHGATFSSIELSEESETVSSGAVQIGNPITEKKMLDVLLEARERRLFRCVTDCGAGGLSSAVGEMGEKTGARVDLERAPLKYEGLSYCEIWISEAQERMVLAVPPERAVELEAIAASEDVDCTDIGSFTDDRRLRLFYQGNLVCDLGMEFLHDGRPQWVRQSLYHRPPSATEPLDAGALADCGSALHRILAMPNVASKEWIIRQYDHEVQGGSVLKPLQGRADDGPGDGVAFLPRLGSARGVVIGCGMNPCYGDLDPYRMALGAVDEALRNIVAAGGDPRYTALLDNFCWGNTDRPETLGSLVEAARGAADAALAFGTPFISGKDSLNNEFRVGSETTSIPPTLLISAVSVVEDVRRLVSMELKRAGSALLLVGITYDELGGSHLLSHLGRTGGTVPDVRLPDAAQLHEGVRAAIASGRVLACHDLAEGGLAVALAEMSFAGGVGASIDLREVQRSGVNDDATTLFSESNTRYLLEVREEDLPTIFVALGGVPAAQIGSTQESERVEVVGLSGSVVIDEPLDTLKDSWQSPLAFEV